MQGDERQRFILARARGAGAVDVQSLAQELEVTTETVRRDLRILEGHGLLRRTHGGAYPVDTRGHEATLEMRNSLYVPEKERIATAAVTCLGPAETVFIDDGSTSQLIARALPEDRPMTILTPALAVASELSARRNARVMLLGGEVRGCTQAATGPWVSQMLDEFVVDLAYMSANGISREYGLTTPEPAVGKLKTHAMKVSRRKVFCGVHTKFGAVSFSRFADFREFETIITDTRLPLAEARRYSRSGTRVVRA